MCIESKRFFDAPENERESVCVIYLVGERAAHHKGWMSGCTSQVEQTPFSQDNDAMAVWEHKAVDLRLDVDLFDLRVVFDSGHIDLVVKVSDVADDGVVLHLFHVVCHDDILVTGGGDKDVGGRKDILQRKNLHFRLQGGSTSRRK